MAVTNTELTVWELAHRLAGHDPDRWYWPRLPLSVRDHIRLLTNEILSWHLDSLLIMEKRRPESEDPPEFYIRSHLDDIYDCIAGHRYPKRFLKFVTVDRSAFRLWCEHSGYPLPEFWFSVDYRSPHEGDEPEPTAAADGRQRSKSQNAKKECREMARKIWAEFPNLRIAEAVRQIRDQGVGAHYAEKTVRKWIQPNAPDGVRNRPGRPKKGDD